MRPLLPTEAAQYVPEARGWVLLYIIRERYKSRSRPARALMNILHSMNIIILLVLYQLHAGEAKWRVRAKTRRLSATI